MKSVYNLNNEKRHTDCKMFLDEANNGVTIARVETVKYPRIQKMKEKQDSFFWRPIEIDVSRDRKDFEDLPDHEKNIFTLNLRRQVLLDSVQGRAPAQVFGAITTLPEIESFLSAWSYMENLHSESYSHIIRNIYSDPTVVFDGINDIGEIVDCANDISKYYDELHRFTQYVDLYGYDDSHTRYDHKKKLYLAMIAVNILEGIRFYVSFACSWNFAEQRKMEGNAKIIKFICRDENVHLGFTQYVINTLPKDDSDYDLIAKETKEECISMFMAAIEQEKSWAKYLFKDGSMIGLTEELLCMYVDWVAKKRIEAIGLKLPYQVPASNPLPWTQSWISGQERQVAPQETEISSYLIGAIDKSKDDNFFEDLKNIGL